MLGTVLYGVEAAWSCLFLPGAIAEPIWSEPESAPGPRTSGAGAAQKSGGFATLVERTMLFLFDPLKLI